MVFDQSTRRGDRTLRVVVGALIVVGVAVVIAFLWVWVPTWRLDAGSYANARSENEPSYGRTLQHVWFGGLTRFTMAACKGSSSG